MGPDRGRFGLRGRALHRLTLGLALVSCTSREPTVIDLGTEAGDALVFLVVLGDTGRAVRTTPVFGLSEGRAAFGDRPELVLAKDESRVVMIAIPQAALTEAIPGFASSERASTELLVASPPDQPQRSLAAEATRVVIEAALPDGLALFEVMLGAGADEALVPIAAGTSDYAQLQGELTLRTSIDPEHCKNPARGPLEPYGAQTRIFADGFTSREMALFGGAIVDAQRVVGQSAFDLYVFHRGEVFSEPAALDLSGPRRHLSMEALYAPDSPGGLSGLALDRRPRPDGKWRVVVAGGRLDATGEAVGQVFDVLLGEDGFERVTTATVVPGLRVRDVAIDASGNVAVIGDEGRVLFQTADTERFVEVPIPAPVPSTEPDESRRIVATSDPAEPWLAGTRNRLHLRQAGGDWSTDTLITNLDTNYHFKGLAAASRTQMWAGASRGRLFRRRAPGAWDPVTLFLPPRYALCAQALGTAEHELLRNIDALAMAGDYLYLSLSDCGAFVEVRTTDLCTSIITPDDLPAALENRRVDRLATFEGEMVAFGYEGLVWSVTVE